MMMGQPATLLVCSKQKFLAIPVRQVQRKEVVNKNWQVTIMRVCFSLRCQYTSSKKASQDLGKRLKDQLIW